MFKKVWLFVICLCFFSASIPVNAEYILKVNESKAEYSVQLQKSLSDGEELPMPSEYYLIDQWIDATTSILENENGIGITDVVKNDDTVTFIFDQNEIEKKLLRDSLRSTEESTSYLGRVSYTAATPYALSTKTEFWYNSESIDPLDRASFAELRSGLSFSLAVLSIGFSNTVLTVLSLVDAVSSVCNVSFDYGARTDIITNVQNGYTTKQVLAYSLSWIPGAQVQRHEQFRETIIRQYAANGDLLGSGIDTNCPNATHSNFDAAEYKDHFYDDAWLQERARQVAVGNAQLYYNVYKHYLPVNE